MPKMDGRNAITLEPVCRSGPAKAPARREFIRLAALGAGASLLGAMPPGSGARAAGSTEALLLSCMDFRLMDDIERYMSGRGLRDKYDHIVLAGAALGAVTDKYPAWHKTFLGTSGHRHPVAPHPQGHRDRPPRLRAYKVILKEDFAKDAKRETEAHAGQMRRLAERIRKKHPKLEVESLLMALNGKVEKIAGESPKGRQDCA